MDDMPKLVVASVEMIKPHEDFDPFRVERLTNRIEAERTQLNPMVCTMAPDGSFVLLDGATRREAFKRLGLPHAIVQLVEPETVSLATWHHVLQNGDARSLQKALDENEGISLNPDTGTPRINVSGNGWRTVQPVGMSSNAALNALVNCYHGRLTVTRVTDASAPAVTRNQGEWIAIVEFPSLTIDDVMIAATRKDFVPAGITRFVVPERALRLNIPLEFLKEADTTDSKQRRLDEILAKRAREGRVRRYAEPVIILDD
jgi:hypothetical protein